MPFYQDVKPKKISRQEHLRRESKTAWEEEGTRYRTNKPKPGAPDPAGKPGLGGKGAYSQAHDAQ